MGTHTAFLDGIIWLSRPSFSEKTCAGTCCNVQVQQLSEQKCYQYFTIVLIISINVHQTASGADVAERIFAKGARKERERRTWPGKVVGHSGFYEKPGFFFQGMRIALQTSNQFSQRTQGENITDFLAWVVNLRSGLLNMYLFRPLTIQDPNRISEHSTNPSNTGFVNRTWIGFVAHLKKMLRAKARERSAKGRRKGCFWEKEYWTTPTYCLLCGASAGPSERDLYTAHISPL